MNLYSPSLQQIPTVSELTHSLKEILETNFSMISVQGEVSQPVVSSNGHLYFTLKDSNAQLSCVMWRTTRSRTQTQLVQGQQITAFGSIKVYAPAGRYQLLVEQVQQAGVGALQAAFERLKKKLEAEGLFSIERKKAIPKFPKRIGVITSETSAAWHDIAVNLEKRWPAAEVLLFHASTQGATSAPELVNGLNFFTKNRNVDVLLIGRGGGSIEDLWPFNEEAVARAIANCPIPVISGVGHETDFTISDFVADVRANTPTQAAIIATPDKFELSQRVDETQKYLYQLVFQKWRAKSQLIQQLTGSYALRKLINKADLSIHFIRSQQEKMLRFLEKSIRKNERILENAIPQILHLKLSKRVERLERGIESNYSFLERSFQTHLQKKQESFIEAENKLNQNNPLIPLNRGFARIIQDGKMIKVSTDLKEHSKFEIQWKDGVKSFSTHSSENP